MYKITGLLDNYANKLVNTMTGGQPTTQDLYNAQQTKAYMEQMARDQAMQQALRQNFPQRPEGAWTAPQNTMTNLNPEWGGLSVSNTQRPIDLNSLLRMLGR